MINMIKGKKTTTAKQIKTKCNIFDQSLLYKGTIEDFDVHPFSQIYP